MGGWVMGSAIHSTAWKTKKRFLLMIHLKGGLRVGKEIRLRPAFQEGLIV